MLSGTGTAIMVAKSVVVVDDHPVVALGVEMALRGSAAFRFGGVIPGPVNALAKIASSAPDVIVFDLVFEGHVHLALVSKTRTLLPLAIIVVFSSLPAATYRRDALAAGADAYLSKASSLTDLVAMMTRLCEDPHERVRQLPVGSSAGHDVPESGSGSDVARLTPREAEIAVYLGRGLPVGRIATLVGSSPNTVAVHRDNLRRKLGCRDSTELVARLARLHANDGLGR